MTNFTQGQMDEYAIESVETERKRIWGILSRVLVEDRFKAIKATENEGELKFNIVTSLTKEELQEILGKVILGNKK